MQKYVIAMKSGRAFEVGIKDAQKFFTDIASNTTEAQNNLYAEGGVMFNINDISAIYPLDCEVGEIVNENAIRKD